MAASLTVKERIEQGRRARERARRRQHGLLGVIGRDPLPLLQASNAGRLERLVPLRYGRMLASPFAFFRGSAILQAHDLAGTPDSGFIVPSCGDCHVSNIGGYATPERQLLLDINDFDESWPAPWEWDLKRMATSFVILARELGLGGSVAGEAAFKVARSYQQRMQAYAGMSALELWYDRITFERLLQEVDGAAGGKTLRRVMGEAEGRRQDLKLPQMAKEEAGGWVIRDKPPVMFHLQGEHSLLTANDDWLHFRHWRTLVDGLFRDYLKTLVSDRRSLLARYTPQDLAFKVVGVGSVGTRCLALLLVDAQESPLFLQIKEARPSVLAAYLRTKSPWRHQGQRVVGGQRLMQAASDLFLGWTATPDGRQFHVRQLRDLKISPLLDSFDSELLLRYAEVCGWVLARAHAKASNLAPELSGYLGESDNMAEALAAYAQGYADQVEKDYERFKRACRRGELEASAEEDFRAQHGF